MDLPIDYYQKVYLSATWMHAWEWLAHKKSRKLVLWWNCWLHKKWYDYSRFGFYGLQASDIVRGNVAFLLRFLTSSQPPVSLGVIEDLQMLTLPEAKVFIGSSVIVVKSHENAGGRDLACIRHLVYCRSNWIGRRCRDWRGLKLSANIFLMKSRPFILVFGIFLCCATKTVPHFHFTRWVWYH